MAIYVYQDGVLVRYDDNGFLDPVDDGANDSADDGDNDDDDESSDSDSKKYAELSTTQVASFDATIAEVNDFNFQDFNIQVMSANQVFSFCDHEYYGELLPLAGRIIGFYKNAVAEDLKVTLPVPSDLGCTAWLQAAQVIAMVAQVPVFAELLGANLFNASEEHVAANFRVSDTLYTLFEEDMSPTVLFSAYKDIYTQVLADAAEGLLAEDYDMVNTEALQSFKAVEAMVPSLGMMNSSTKTSPGASEFESAIGVIQQETRKRFYAEYYPKFLTYMSSIFSLYADFETTREVLLSQVGVWVVREISKYAYSDQDSKGLLEALLSKFSVNEETGIMSYACVPWEESGELYAEYTNIRYEHFFEQLIAEFPLMMQPFPDLLVNFANAQTQSSYVATPSEVVGTPTPVNDEPDDEEEEEDDGGLF